MPDISMCTNDVCPSSKKCYRYMAEPSVWQSYMGYTVPDGETQCDNFWPLIAASTPLRKDMPDVKRET